MTQRGAAQGRLTAISLDKAERPAEEPESRRVEHVSDLLGCSPRAGASMCAFKDDPEAITSQYDIPIDPF